MHSMKPVNRKARKVEAAVIEATGDTEKLDEFLEVMRSYGEIEVTRSGLVVVSLDSKKLKLAPPVSKEVAHSI